MSSPRTSEDSLRKIIHDLSNELFLIRGNAELAMNALENNPTLEQKMKTIMERTDEMNKIIQRLRQKQHTWEGKPE